MNDKEPFAHYRIFSKDGNDEVGRHQPHDICELSLLFQNVTGIQWISEIVICDIIPSLAIIDSRKNIWYDNT